MQTRSNIKNRAIALIKLPRNQIIVCAALGGAACFVPSYSHESAKEGQIPVGFSEIGHLRHCVERFPQAQMTDYCGKIAVRYGNVFHEIPALTNYFSAVNDVFMMVAEANNEAYSSWGTKDKFAYELEKKIDPAFRIHHQIPEYASQIGVLANKAKTSIQPLTHARADIQPVIGFLESAWDEQHDDVYIPTPVMSTSCDSKGACSTTVTIQMVYDHTDHTYTYHPDQARKAMTRLDDYFRRNQDIKVHEPFIMPWTTNAENEYAMRISRKMELANKRPQDEDYKAWANTWAKGSTYNVFTPQIYAAHSRLQGDVDALKNAASTATSVQYPTHSPTDAGPIEFQLNTKAISEAKTVDRGVSAIEDGINTSASVMPKLNAEIRRFTDAKLHGKGEIGNLRDDVINDARKLYRSNFTNGFDVRPAKWEMVALWTFLGGLGGAGGAIGAQVLTARRQERKRDRGYGSYSMR